MQSSNGNISSIWSDQPPIGAGRYTPVETRTTDSERQSWEVERQSHERERQAWSRERDLLQALLDNSAQKGQKGVGERAVAIFWPVDENAANGTDLLSRLDPIDVVDQLLELAQPHGELGPFKGYSASGLGDHQDTLESLGVQLRSCSKLEGRSSTTYHICLDALEFALTATLSPSQVTVVLVTEDLSHLPLLSKLKAIGCKVVLVARFLNSSKRLLRAVASEVHELDRPSPTDGSSVPHQAPAPATNGWPQPALPVLARIDVPVTSQASAPVTPISAVEERWNPVDVETLSQADPPVSADDWTTPSQQPASEEPSGWGLEPEEPLAEDPSGGAGGWGLETVSDEPSGSWEGEGWGVPPPPGHVRPQAVRNAITDDTDRRPTASPSSQVRQPAQPAPSSWATAAQPPAHLPPPPPPAPKPTQHQPATETVRPAYIHDDFPPMADAPSSHPQGDDENQSPILPLAKAPSASVDPTVFRPLLNVVASFAPADSRPLRTKCAVILSKAKGAKEFYAGVGFADWKSYALAAQKQGLVELEPGAGQGYETIALTEAGNRVLAGRPAIKVSDIKAPPAPAPKKPTGPFAPLLEAINNIPSHFPNARCVYIASQLKKTYGDEFYRNRDFYGWKAYLAEAIDDGWVKERSGEDEFQNWVELTDKGRRALGLPVIATSKNAAQKTNAPALQGGAVLRGEDVFAPLLKEIANIPSYHKQAHCARIHAQLRKTYGTSFFSDRGFAEWTAYTDQAVADGWVEMGQGDTKFQDWIALTESGRMAIQAYEEGPSTTAPPRPASAAPSLALPSDITSRSTTPAGPDDAIFMPLIELLGNQLETDPKPFLSLTGSALARGDPSFFTERGMANWRAYGEAAERAGWVTMGKGEMGGKDWIALTAKGREAALWGI